MLLDSSLALTPHVQFFNNPGQPCLHTRSRIWPFLTVSPTAVWSSCLGCVWKLRWLPRPVPALLSPSTRSITSLLQTPCGFSSCWEQRPSRSLLGLSHPAVCPPTPTSPPPTLSWPLCPAPAAARCSFWGPSTPCRGLGLLLSPLPTPFLSSCCLFKGVHVLSCALFSLSLYLALFYLWHTFFSFSNMQTWHTLIWLFSAASSVSRQWLAQDSVNIRWMDGVLRQHPIPLAFWLGFFLTVF